MNEIVWDMKQAVQDQEGQISSLREELRKLNHSLSVMFADMTEMKRLLTPLKEEKKKQEAIAKAKAEIASAERIIEEAKKVIASGGEEEGYW